MGLGFQLAPSQAPTPALGATGPVQDCHRYSAFTAHRLSREQGLALGFGGAGMWAWRARAQGRRGWK